MATHTYLICDRCGTRGDIARTMVLDFGKFNFCKPLSLSFEECGMLDLCDACVRSFDGWRLGSPK